MHSKSVVAALACMAVLSGCATDSVQQKAPTLAASMAEADIAIKAGQPEKAVLLLKASAAAFPTEKEPWLRIAQLRYQSDNYGEAIIHAAEVLARDPNNTVAHSIVAVSGLRLSSKALADLARKNNLKGDIKTEAQELAKLLRESLREKELVPPLAGNATKAGSVKPRPPNPNNTASTAPQPIKPRPDDNPF